MPPLQCNPACAEPCSAPSQESPGAPLDPCTTAESTIHSAAAVEELALIAKRLRRHVVASIGRAGSGHPGGSLSAADIIACLYFRVLRHDPANPQWADRDRFVLSKGHAAPVLYAALAEAGYFPVEELLTLRRLDSRLQGHATLNATPGVEMSSGSLGQGLSFGIGIALAGKLDRKDYKVYVLLGDGECEEGQVWEAVMLAAHWGLNNLVAIVDNNGLQIDGTVQEMTGLEPLADKWHAFGWNTIDVDGHDFFQLTAAFEQASQSVGKPTVIIAHTIKGKGVSFMEGNLDFHGRAPDAEELAWALKELA